MVFDGVDVVVLEGFLWVLDFFALGDTSLQRSWGREISRGCQITPLPLSPPSAQPVAEELLYILVDLAEASKQTGHPGLENPLQMDLVLQGAIGWHQERR